MGNHRPLQHVSGPRLNSRSMGVKRKTRCGCLVQWTGLATATGARQHPVAGPTYGLWHLLVMDQGGERSGVLLINLGTPDAPTPKAVRRYLREFLSDPRVLDMNGLARGLFLYGVILPFRPKRSARAYAQIWTPDGSPLLVHSRALRDGLARDLGPGFTVELGMRYGTPSIESALEKLGRADARELLVFPLFPQYSDAATGSALARAVELVSQLPGLPAPPPDRLLLRRARIHFRLRTGSREAAARVRP